MSKSIKNQGLTDYEDISVSSLDDLGKHIFHTLPEIANKHPNVIRNYYHLGMHDYQQNNVRGKSNAKHTEKLDNATYQRLNWLKEKNCGFYHDIISRAVLMAYVLYRADLNSHSDK